MNTRIAVKIALLFIFLSPATASWAGIKQEVRFKPGSSGAVIEQTVIRGERDQYSLGAKKGQYLRLEIGSLEDNAEFDVYLPGAVVKPDGNVLGILLTGANSKKSFVGPLPAAGKYLILVGGTRGNAQYKLTVSITNNMPNDIGEMGATTGPKLSMSALAGGPRVMLSGQVKAPEEAGDPYYLAMPIAQQFNGDQDCGSQVKKTIDLWDKKEKLSPLVGKNVTVSGVLDCPRGGYVMRSVAVEKSAPKPTAPSVARQIEPPKGNLLEMATHPGMSTKQLFARFKDEGGLNIANQWHGLQVKGLETEFDSRGVVITVSMKIELDHYESNIFGIPTRKISTPKEIRETLSKVCKISASNWKIYDAGFEGVGETGMQCMYHGIDELVILTSVAR